MIQLYIRQVSCQRIRLKREWGHTFKSISSERVIADISPAVLVSDVFVEIFDESEGLLAAATWSRSDCSDAATSDDWVSQDSMLTNVAAAEHIWTWKAAVEVSHIMLPLNTQAWCILTACLLIRVNSRSTWCFYEYAVLMEGVKIWKFCHSWQQYYVCAKIIYLQQETEIAAKLFNYL